MEDKLRIANKVNKKYKELMNEMDDTMRQTMEEIGIEEATALLEQSKAATALLEQSKAAATKVTVTTSVSTAPVTTTTVTTSLKCKTKKYSRN